MDLVFENILGEQEIEDLFTAPEDTEETKEENQPSEDGDETEEKNDETTTTEVVNPETLFEEDEPESVGSGKKEEKEKGDTVPDEGSDTSPNKNFYSSIAQACAVDGIFPNLDEETIKKADSAESFSDLIEAEINARLDEKQQRIAKALENGVEPSEIKKYENALNYISSITDKAISAETEDGEQLRGNLIYQDFINKGYSPERAKKLTERSIDAGTDIEDAKDALQSNKEYFQNTYDKLLKEAQDKADEEKENIKKQAEKLKNSIMKDKDLMGDIELSAELRKKAFDNISRPIYKDSETGEYLTAFQKYQMEHKEDFIKYTGLIFTLTDGFKDFDSFTKGKVKKEMKKGLRELEQTLNTTRRSSDGSLKMMTGVSEDPESFIRKGFKLDL